MACMLPARISPLLVVRLHDRHRLSRICLRLLLPIHHAHDHETTEVFASPECQAAVLAWPNAVVAVLTKHVAAATSRKVAASLAVAEAAMVAVLA